MKFSSAPALLFIEPLHPVSSEPVNDELTLGMEKIFARAENESPLVVLMPQGVSRGFSTKGTHRCCCGERSHPRDYEFRNGMVTNSLCVHYLRWHRSEVPAEELQKVRELCASEADRQM